MDGADLPDGGDDTRLSMQITLAGLSAASGGFAQAFALLDQIFDQARETGRTSIKAHAMTLVGCVYAATGSLMEARDAFSRAVLLHQRAGDAEAVGKVYNNIGACHYLDDANFVDAIPFLELGLDFVSGRADALVVLNVLSNNIRAFEELYQQRAGVMREHADELARCIPEGMRRLSDLSALQLGSSNGVQRI